VAAHEAQARLVQRHAHRDAPLQLYKKNTSSHHLILDDGDDDDGGVAMPIPCCRGTP
jgi:hypothetical protein